MKVRIKKMLHITVGSLLVFGMLTARIAVAKAEFKFENYVLLSAYVLSLVLLLVVPGYFLTYIQRYWKKQSNIEQRIVLIIGNATMAYISISILFKVFVALFQKVWGIFPPN